jgi:AraC-like ligand binding domain
MAAQWSRYWRSADGPLEAMHAHFERHVYHRHSHETYSFGVTDTGVQSFACRGAARHLTRWFVRCYGITPGGYQRAVLPDAPQPPPGGDFPQQNSGGNHVPRGTPGS